MPDTAVQMHALARTPPRLRVAVVTPFFSEKPEELEQARRSVRRQTWPSVLHILVGDASALRPSEDDITRIVHLPQGTRDFGDTPRSIGALYAVGLGVDAVAFLDGDNWYAPQHLQALIQAHLKTGAALVTCQRNLHRVDGTYMAQCVTSDGEQFCDTSCYLILRPGFELLSRWALLGPRYHAIDDRLFWRAARATGLPRAHVSQPTVAYRVQFQGAYLDLGEPVPEGVSRGPAVGMALRSWEQEHGSSLALRWTYRRHVPPTKLINIRGLTIPERNGVSLTRVRRPLQSLADQGFARVAVGSHLHIPHDEPPGVLVLHRQFLNDPGVLDSLNRMAARGWLLVSDIDDDPHHWEGYVSSDMVAFRGVHAVTVSTEPLAQLLRAWNPTVEVLPNMLDDLPAVLRVKRERIEGPQAQQAPAAANADNGRPLRLFLGAFNGLADASTLLQGLALVPLRERSNWEVLVVGDHAVYAALPVGYKSRFHAECSWAEYMELMAACDAALLPLADTHSNRQKSDLKLIEALAAGAVPICAPTVYASLHPNPCPYALFALDAADWAAHLRHLQQDRLSLNARQRAGYRYVQANRMQWQQNTLRFSVYQKWISRHTELESQRRARLHGWRSQLKFVPSSKPS